jgi:hypothetical protein
LFQSVIKRKYTLLKTITVIALSLTIVACGARMAEPYDENKAPEDRENYAGLKGMKQQQKDQNSLTKQANKIKCQDARLDLVDAEALGDINTIRQVKSLIQKLCVP